ncbi:hypothetical protein SAMN03159300_103535 [Janthinobacterium sp. 344]|nr:hypothetical protein SAMN03159349_02530 [Janthinobacterium sp. 551a]SFB35065.1 hypothetical protein SAMN03159300_103535 [Janthinobacterium sp. 344]
MGMSTQEIERIVALQAPILCLDTCSVLDTMRDPTRDMINAADSAAALFLLTKMESKSALIGLLAPQVKFELTDNLQKVQDEATKAIGKLKAKVSNVEAIAAAFGSIGKSDLKHLDNHIKKSRAAVDRMIKIAVTFDEPHGIHSKAFLRVNQGRTPATKGKESSKDCVVIESYLSIVETLRSAGWKGKGIFVSSNTKDYRGETGNGLKGDLAAEFIAIGMEYAPTMGGAKFALGL